MQNEDTELGSNQYAIPNPKRVAAGRLNWSKRNGLASEGRERLRRAAHANRPWQYATGPRTAEGKAKAAANGRTRQLGMVSLRELKADLRQLRILVKDMADARSSVDACLDSHTYA